MNNNSAHTIAYIDIPGEYQNEDKHYITTDSEKLDIKYNDIKKRISNICRALKSHANDNYTGTPIEFKTHLQIQAHTLSKPCIRVAIYAIFDDSQKSIFKGILDRINTDLRCALTEANRLSANANIIHESHDKCFILTESEHCKKPEQTVIASNKLSQRIVTDLALLNSHNCDLFTFIFPYDPDIIVQPPKKTFAPEDDSTPAFALVKYCGHYARKKIIFLEILQSNEPFKTMTPTASYEGELIIRRIRSNEFYDVEKNCDYFVAEIIIIKKISSHGSITDYFLKKIMYPSECPAPLFDQFELNLQPSK